jgi:Na+-translocating ferredoxin:NAD+ oxidoreductase subunit D
VRQLWRALHGVPQLLLVQPEQLTYDLAYALALLPLVVAAIVYFLQDSLLLLALSFLAGIVCLLAIQLARLTFGLPAWIGFKANHPLVASMLIACFFSPRTPAWVAAALVMLYIVMDTLFWPQLRRVMIHPALIVFGLLYIIQRQLGVGYVNPFDGRQLDDPLTLWYKFQIVVDPIKLYVGNVAGPIGVTSMGAVLLGAIYLWYTRKISLGIAAGFLCGVAVVALAIRSDLGFQLASGPSLFVAAYVAADRRRVLLPEPFTFAFGAAAGIVTVLLRWYGMGLQAAWLGFLLVGVAVTAALLALDLRRQRLRAAARPAPVRTLAVDSGEPDPHRLWAPARTPLRQPVMAAAPVATAYSRSGAGAPLRGFDSQGDPNDLVRQMRSAASRGNGLQAAGSNAFVILPLLLLVNPIGLWLTWRSPALNSRTKLLLSAISVLWYLGVAGLALALLIHR